MELMAKYQALIREILALKKKKHAIILAHNYQRPEIYEAADYVGDSLGLCKAAMKSKSKRIIFCGINIF
ncbi:quinolinate synthase NadA [Candidatus Peregrinibacteria bacterium]|nr:quinolinate synthase NadA [Candidatus Peregrinibacteria bacterium]